MSVQYAPSYIDAIFERKDACGLDVVMCARARSRILPDECLLFQRGEEWLGSTRSGAWLYYESLREEDFRLMCRLLAQFEMPDILQKYREGMAVWKDEKAIAAVDGWMSTHEAEIEERFFQQARRASDFLKQNEG